MESKDWGGIELPSHLDHEGAVEHCLHRIECELTSVGVPFDRAAAETLLRSWGLASAVEILHTSLDAHEKLKEWWAKRQIRLIHYRLQNGPRFA